MRMAAILLAGRASDGVRTATRDVPQTRTRPSLARPANKISPMLMTDDELQALLAGRIASVEARVTAACQRAGRPRGSVTIVAITKTVSIRVAALLPELGLPNLGENRPQELWKKAAAIPDATWHFTGHLQRNKIDRTLPHVALLHTVDSERLAIALHAFAIKASRSIPILFEVNCSREAAKGGVSAEELPAFADKAMTLTGLRIEGLMTMAAHAGEAEECRPTFAALRSLRDGLRERTGWPLPHLSMGMTNDFEIAIEEGATFIRLGTILFEGLEAE